jgi:hypothetical protein
MKKLGGLVGSLKFVLKYAIYVMAVIKIVEFAIATLNEVETAETPKIAENE